MKSRGKIAQALKNEKTERILCILGSSLFVIVCLIILFGDGEELIQTKLVKITTTGIVYVMWIGRIIKNNLKIKKFYQEIIDEDEEALKGALHDKEVKELFRKGFYEYTAKNMDRAGMYIQEAYEKSSNYSDRALACYMQALFFYITEQFDKALKEADKAVSIRPNFKRAIVLQRNSAYMIAKGE